MCVIALISGSATLFAETDIREQPNQVEAGKALNETHCIACCQKDSDGEIPGPWGFRDPDYRFAIPLNETSHTWHHGDEQLTGMILNGIPGNPRMPPRENLSSTRPKHMSCMH